MSRWLQAGRMAGAGLLGLLALLTAPGCGSMQDPWKEVPGSPRVLTSFPPMYCFARNVAGDEAAILCLCTTKGPHDYQYNVADTVKLQRADAFFVNGLGMEDHFTDKLASATRNNRLHYRKLGDLLAKDLRRESEHDHDHAAEGEEHHHHHHGKYDPHLWLGIPQVLAMLEILRDDLKKLNPDRAAEYDRNTAAYSEKLKKLQVDGVSRLKGLRKVPVITFHESLGYFADSFDLNIVGSIHPSAGLDPSARNIKEVLKLCKDEERVVVTSEPQYASSSAEVLAKELRKVGVKDVRIVEIDPLETCELGDLSSDWYERRMRKNIDTLVGCIP